MRCWLPVISQRLRVFQAVDVSACWWRDGRPRPARTGETPVPPPYYSSRGQGNVRSPLRGWILSGASAVSARNSVVVQFVKLPPTRNAFCLLGVRSGFNNDEVNIPMNFSIKKSYVVFAVAGLVLISASAVFAFQATSIPASRLIRSEEH